MEASSEEFAGLVERQKAAVFRTLARLLGPAGDLEDLAQEVFLRVYRGLKHFRGEASLSTWLYRIVINVANDELRRRHQSRVEFSIDDREAGWGDRLSHPPADPGERLDRDRFLESLSAAMDDLDARDRAILTLFYQEERRYQEIAEILDLPMGTVKTQLHRARLKLKILVKERLSVCKTPS